MICRKPPVSVAAIAVGLMLGGCAPTPRLAVVPDLISQDWSEPSPAETVERPPSVADLLRSPEIARLTELALTANPNLLAAQARIDQALGTLRIARGAALPLVSISNGASLTRVDRVNSATGALGSTFDFATSFAAIDASYAVDLGGGISAGKRAAKERARAAQFDQQELAFQLASDIARTYVQRSTLEARLALIDRNIAATTRLQRVLELRQREGFATRVDVGLQVIRVRELAAERSRIDEALGQTRTALALLVGEESPRFVPVSIDIDSFSRTAPPVPKPSEIVIFRPDVLAAEARIRAAGGDVKQARAAFLPRLDLSINRSSQTVLSGGPLAGLTIGASLFAPIFNRSRLKGDLEIAAAAQREAVQNYRQALLGALADIEDSMSAVHHASNRGSILADIDRESRRTASLAQQQYLEGDADLRDVLDAQDLLIRAQDARALNVQEQLEATIALYRATRRAADVTPGRRVASRSPRNGE